MGITWLSFGAELPQIWFSLGLESTDSAVNAALAAFYSQQQAKRREELKAERDADKAAEAAVKRAVRSVQKQANEDKKKADAAAAHAEAERKAVDLAHANSLFEMQ